MDDAIDITCPRCGAEGPARFYGPCQDCRDELRARFASDGRTVDVAAYEPKVNVVANSIATKD